VARRHMRHERVGHTLQASALVNEAYLRLIQIKQVRWQDRLHFIAVEMRFFGGLSAEETAEALQLSTGTIMRDWRLAKSWLARELEGRRHDA